MRRLISNYIQCRPRLIKKLLGIFVRLHNYSYKKITEYASLLEGGINPKHRITRYHEYFLQYITAADRVLDIGCGGGLLACDMGARANRVVGIDISACNITYAKKHCRRNNVEFIVGDATTQIFTEQFDKLVLSNVLEHIDDRVGLLKKIKPLGPILLFRVPMISRDWTALYKREQGYPYKLDDTHTIEYRLEDLEHEFTAAGWIVVSSQVNWGEFWAVLKQA